jgi:hypothetical protein
MTANSTATKKGKSRALQNRIAEKIRRRFDLPKEDVMPAPMGLPGIDIRLSDRARAAFPWAVECKHHEVIELRLWLQQTRTNCDLENRTAGIPLRPLLVMRLSPCKGLRYGGDFAIVERKDLCILLSRHPCPPDWWILTKSKKTIQFRQWLLESRGLCETMQTLTPLRPMLVLLLEPSKGLPEGGEFAVIEVDDLIDLQARVNEHTATETAR